MGASTSNEEDDPMSNLSPTRTGPDARPASKRPAPPGEALRRQARGPDDEGGDPGAGMEAELAVLGRRVAGPNADL